MQGTKCNGTKWIQPMPHKATYKEQSALGRKWILTFLASSSSPQSLSVQPPTTELITTTTSLVTIPLLTPSKHKLRWKEKSISAKHNNATIKQWKTSSMVENEAKLTYEGCHWCWDEGWKVARMNNYQKSGRVLI